MRQGRSLIYYTQWWISTLFGLAVMLTGLAFSLLGDGQRWAGRRAGDTTLTSGCGGTFDRDGTMSMVMNRSKGTDVQA